MIRSFAVVLIGLSLSGCAVFKTKLVPQAYMPEPPAILMKAPKDLNTIKQEEPKQEEPK